MNWVESSLLFVSFIYAALFFAYMLALGAAAWLVERIRKTKS